MTRLFSFRRGHAVAVFLVGLAAFSVGLWVGSGTPMHSSRTELSFWSVFLNNLRVAGLTTGLGLLSFGVGGLLVFAYNLLILGITVSRLYIAEGFGPIRTGILPHGVVEVAAMALSAVLGFEVWRWLTILRLRGVNGRAVPLEWRSTVVLVVVAVTLLAAAAGIESSVSHVQEG